MVTAGFFLRFGCTTAAVVASGVLVGCSSGSNSTSAPATSGRQPSAGHSSPSPSTAAGPTKDPYPALCRRIRPATVQPLFSGPLAPMTTGGSSDCQFVPRSGGDIDTLKVYLRIDDADKTLFNHVGDISYGTFSPLTGTGYQAKWGSTSGSAPTVVDVRKGDFTCTVIPPASVADLTLAHTGSAYAPHVTTAVARAYARELGMICGDVFAAG